MRSNIIYLNVMTLLLMIFSISEQRIYAAERCPCDIYKDAGTPCVAAHSTIRALYANYNGPLYQVRRTSDNKTMDIGVLTTGGVANAAAQDSFLDGKAGTISIIYDQSPNHNDLRKSPVGGWLKNGGLEANATAAKIKLNGHTVYGIYTTSSWDDNVGAVGYRNDSTKGVPTGDNPESMYMVCSGKHYNQWCCFDYGNAEKNNLDNGKATMECVYFGSNTQWSKGNGTGPWVMGDLEDGVYHGGDPNVVTPSNTSINADYVTAMLKGPSGNHYGLKAADAQSGKLMVKYDGPRPAGYSPQKKEGAIILGTGGDNSHTGEGTFFEGCMTSGNPSDAVDDSIQANIVAAGYGSNVTYVLQHTDGAHKLSNFKANYNSFNNKAVINFTLQSARHLSINIVDQCGRRVDEIVNSMVSAGSHTAVWDAKHAPAGVYLWRIAIDGREGETGKIIVGK